MKKNDDDGFRFRGLSAESIVRIVGIICVAGTICYALSLAANIASQK